MENKIVRAGVAVVAGAAGLVVGIVLSVGGLVQWAGQAARR